jgi:aspartate/methionine/tyrosine aminotransferase
MPTLSKRVTAAPSSATVLIADVAADMRARGVDVLDFAGGRAAEETPDFISRAAIRALEAGATHQTHAQGTRAFREACALKLRRDNGVGADPETEIIATMGCKQGLTISLLAAIDAGDEVIVEDPGFVSYAPTIEFCGGVPVPVPLRPENGFRWDPAEVEAAVTPRTRAIILCSPHNPTGSVHEAADLDAVADVATRHDLFVIADSIYERVTWAGRPFLPISARPAMSERTITLMGLTKSCAMGGWRIGFVHAAAAVIQSMLRLQQHLITCVSAIAQAGGTAAMAAGEVDVLRAMWEDWERRCAYVTGALASVPGIVCRMPEAGYYAWTDVRGFAIPSVELAGTILREHEVAVVPGSAFGPEGEGWLRITCVRSWAEIREAVPRLQTALSALPVVR